MLYASGGVSSDLVLVESSNRQRGRDLCKFFLSIFCDFRAPYIGKTSGCFGGKKLEVIQLPPLSAVYWQFQLSNFRNPFEFEPNTLKFCVHVALPVYFQIKPVWVHLDLCTKSYGLRNAAWSDRARTGTESTSSVQLAGQL
jgi:hypothetical protein